MDETVIIGEITINRFTLNFITSNNLGPYSTVTCRSTVLPKRLVLTVNAHDGVLGIVEVASETLAYEFDIIQVNHFLLDLSSLNSLYQP